MNQSEARAARETYFSLMAMNGALRVLRTAQELGVLQALGSGPRDAAGVAGLCGLQVQPTALLLEALGALGVVQEQNGQFSLAPVMHFLAQHYQDLSGSYWDYLAEFIKTGVPMARVDDAEESAPHYAKQAAALGWMMGPAATWVAEQLALADRPHPAHILDVGAGSGVWGQALAREFPDASLTLQDWPAVLDAAQGAAAASELASRILWLPGDYHHVEFPCGHFQLCLLANVAHLETSTGLQVLLSRLHAALAPGGRLILIDVMPGQERAALAASLYALGLALRTRQARVHVPAELQRWLRAAGFQCGDPMPIAAPPYNLGMLIGTAG